MKQPNRGAELTKLSTSKVKSYQQLINWLMKMEYSAERDEAVRYFSEQILNINTSGGITQMTMTQDTKILFDEFLTTKNK